jgi:hypothetical protein
MKETIDQLMELLQDQGYKMSPDLLQKLTGLVKNLDKETESLVDLLQQMHLDYEHLADCKVVEYASYLTQTPKPIVFQNYGAFKLQQQIENQLQNELN